MKMDAYVITWKDTTLNEDGTFDTESGVCETAYENNERANEKLKELVECQLQECLDELGYDADALDTKISTDYGCVTAGSNTYEFSIFGIDIDKSI